MVGLKNQGATCYLNSLLQSLYFTNAFRKVSGIAQIVTHGGPELIVSRLFIKFQPNMRRRKSTVLGRCRGYFTSCKAVNPPCPRRS